MKNTVKKLGLVLVLSLFVVSCGSSSKAKDNNAQLTGSSPANNAKRVELDSTLILSFNKQLIDEKISLTKGTEQVLINVTKNANKISVQPSSKLDYNTLYTLNISAKNLKNLSLNFTSIRQKLFVLPASKGDATGSSWQNATNNIQDAINKMSAVQGEVWFGAQDFTLTKTIDLKENVHLYGGFKETQTSLEARDLSVPTSLLGGGVVRVLEARQKRGIVLDGFKIANGLTASNGGGLYLNDSSVSMQNITFENNKAEFGGALYNTKSSPSLKNVAFIGNKAKSGGAIYNSSSSHPRITNASFTGNKLENPQDGDGGVAIYEHTNSGSIITNATFSDHAIVGSNDVKGAVFAINGAKDILITNSTFYKNTGGETIYNHDSAPTIKNSILWGNNTQIQDASTKSIVSNSIISSGFPNNLEVADPLLSKAKTKTINGVTHTYYELEANSPAINKGDNTANTETTDQIGSPRKNSTIDIGAIEKQ